MRCQVLSSGSRGNATLVRAGELSVLVDAGLPPRELRMRLAAAGLPHRGIDHVLVTHGHLDHSRSAGSLARRHGATVHCPPTLMRQRSVRRAPQLAAVRVGAPAELVGRGDDRVVYRATLLPHDCDPTLAYRVEHRDRVLAVVTDMGRHDDGVARWLRDCHVLVLEFNHDPGMLDAGPYSDALKRRIRSGRGHLSNGEAARMLAAAAGPGLHTVVLAHLSQVNNTPELARAAARAALEERGRADVRVLVASQSEVGESLRV